MGLSYSRLTSTPLITVHFPKRPLDGVEAKKSSTILFSFKLRWELFFFFSISMFSKRGNKMLSAHGSSKRESPLEGFKLQSRALVLACFSQPRKPQSTY